MNDVSKMSPSPDHTGLEVPMDSLESSNTTAKVSEQPNNLKAPKRNVFKSKIFIATVAFSVILITLMCIGFLVHYEIGSDITDGEVKFWDVNIPPEQLQWYEKGIDELRAALSIEQNRRRAKNVILFMGDGMGPNTVTASRIYAYKEEGFLSWEQFSHMGLLKVSITVNIN